CSQRRSGCFPARGLRGFPVRRTVVLRVRPPRLAPLHAAVLLLPKRAFRKTGDDLRRAYFDFSAPRSTPANEVDLNCSAVIVRIRRSSIRTEPPFSGTVFT